ncbi:MAG: hypothetical protein J0I47_05380 [Sphingomonas sp.]|uniref:hypothetical protein n=1 Tax=Sphingomonas sp. TaxID=28214 RepID=UPI001AC341BF|nr:hypothetical protein [Sphingomonas sp.]MBN8807656.1 hypothetical protein [Sphingomonas sp.]
MDPLLLIPILFVIGVGTASATFPWSSFRLGRGRAWAAAPIVPPLVALGLGWLFRVRPGDLHPASIVVFFLCSLLLISAAMIVVMPLLMKDRRIFGASIAIAMLGLTMGATFVAAMQVTGNWI